jgi:hypothetical protein
VLRRHHCSPLRVPNRMSRSAMCKPSPHFVLGHDLLHRPHVVWIRCI